MGIGLAFNVLIRLIKEWVSFFLGSWGMNRRAGQTNRVNRYDSFPMNPEKKTLIPNIYNASNKDTF